MTEKRQHCILCSKSVLINLWALMLVLSNNILAQNIVKDFYYYDAKTYQLYMEQKWDSVITLTKEALAKGYNSYYLQMRIGIAHYEKKQYSEAIPYFETAMKMDANDIVAEYLYYSYLFDGQWRTARFFTKKMSPALLKKIHLSPPRFLDNIEISYSYVSIDNWNTLRRYLAPPNSLTNYRLEKEMSGPFVATDLGINWQLSQNYSLITQVSHYRINSYQLLYHDFDIKNENNYLLNEYEFYLALTNWQEHKSTTFVTNVQYFSADKYQYLYLYPVIVTQPTPRLIRYEYKVSQINFNKLSVMVGGIFSKFNYQTTKNLFVGVGKIIDYYVAFGNYMLTFMNKKGTIWSNTQISAAIDIWNFRPAGYIQQSFTVYPFRFLSLNTSFAYGKIKNMPNFDGSIIFNTTYAIDWRWANTITLFPFKKLGFYVGYIFQQNTQSDEYYFITQIDKKGSFREKIQPVDYPFKSKIIIGGIIWKL